MIRPSRPEQSIPVEVSTVMDALVRSLSREGRRQTVAIEPTSRKAQAFSFITQTVSMCLRVRDSIQSTGSSACHNALASTCPSLPSQKNKDLPSVSKKPKFLYSFMTSLLQIIMSILSKALTLSAAQYPPLFSGKQTELACLTVKGSNYIPIVRLSKIRSSRPLQIIPVEVSTEMALRVRRYSGSKHPIVRFPTSRKGQVLSPSIVQTFIRWSKVNGSIHPSGKSAEYGTDPVSPSQFGGALKLSLKTAYPSPSVASIKRQVMCIFSGLRSAMSLGGSSSQVKVSHLQRLPASSYLPRQKPLICSTVSSSMAQLLPISTSSNSAFPKTKPKRPSQKASSLRFLSLCLCSGGTLPSIQSITDCPSLYVSVPTVKEGQLINFPVGAHLSYSCLASKYSMNNYNTGEQYAIVSV